MGAHANHHTALRVADLDRIAGFYVEALDGRMLTAPVLHEGPYIEEVHGPGTRVRVCIVGFATGAVELWQFHEPARPVPACVQTEVPIMHFALRVDDVEEALRRVEAAGGRARFPVKLIGDSGGRFVYCEDPEGHVFELLDTGIEETARMIIVAAPHAAPPGVTSAHE